MKEQKNKLKIIIIVLAVLLALSVAGLATVLLYNHFAPSEPAFAELPGNIITPDAEDPVVEPPPPANETQGGEENRGTVPPSAPAPSSEPTSATEAPSGSNSTKPSGAASTSGTKVNALVLHNRNPGDNVPFQVTNMFPGDAETRNYCVKVSYKGDIVVRYHADIRKGYEKLAEVLKVRIYMPDADELLYDGLMRDMPKSLNHPLYTNASTQNELYYEITAYLDTSVGNEYMEKALIADFRWWVEETNNLDSPVTGDTSNVRLWIYLAAGSLALLLILLAVRRREADDEAE